MYSPPMSSVPAAELFAALKEAGIYVRYFPGERTGNHLRITVGTREQTGGAAGILKEISEMNGGCGRAGVRQSLAAAAGFPSAAETKRRPWVEAYTDFAQVYDTFMDNAPYDRWADFLAETSETRTASGTGWCWTSAAARGR